MGGVRKRFIAALLTCLLIVAALPTAGLAEGAGYDEVLGASRVTVGENAGYTYFFNTYPDNITPIIEYSVIDISKITRDATNHYMLPVKISVPANIAGITSCEVEMKPSLSEDYAKNTYTISDGNIAFNISYAGEKRFEDEAHLLWYAGETLVRREILYYGITNKQMNKPAGYENVQGTPADRVSIILPTGLAENDVTVSKGNGFVDIVLNKVSPEAWKNVYTQAPGTLAYITVKITPPATAVKYWSSQGNSIDYGTFNAFINNKDNFKAISQNIGWMNEIVQYEVNTDGTAVMALPVTWKNHYLYLAWMDAAGNVTPEIQVINVRPATGVGAVTFDLPTISKVPAERLSGEILRRDDKPVASNFPVTLATPTDGSIIFNITDEVALKSEGVDVNANVLVEYYPEAISYTVSNLGKTIMSGGGYRYFGFGRRILDKEKISTCLETYVITWTLPDGSNVCETFDLAVRAANKKWMDKYWSPIDAERLKVDEIFEISGLEVQASDGYIRTAINIKAADFNIKWLRGAHVAVKPPESIADRVSYCKANQSGGSGIDDYSDFRADSHLTMMNSRSEHENFPYRVSVNWLRSVTVDDLTVYFEMQEQSRTLIIEWYDADDKLIEVNGKRGEYVALAADPFVTEVKTPAKPKIEDVTEKVDDPVMVSPEMLGWYLKCAMFAQEGAENEYYFQLTAMNALGFETKLLGNASLLLPYRFTGLTYEQAKNYNFSLNHYDDDHNLAETLTVKAIDKGLLIESVSSLSPFVLEWSAQSNDPNPGRDVTNDEPLTPAETPVYSPATTQTTQSAGKVKVTGQGVAWEEISVVEQKSTDAGAENMTMLAEGGEVIGLYNISFKSGRKANGEAMYLTFEPGAQYAGQACTLVHRKADNTLEYFYATADMNGKLSFGPLYELSPFMLVKGTIMPKASTAPIPQTDDNASPAGFVMLGLAAIVAAAALGKRREGR